MARDPINVYLVLLLDLAEWIKMLATSIHITITF